MTSAAAGRRFRLRDFVYVLVSVPVSLALWLVGKSFSRFSNASEYSLTPLRSFLSTLFPFIFMIYGFRKRSVNKSGAIFGIIVALILTIASPVYLVVLAAFFFSSSKATKYKQDFKKNFEKDFKESGQRNWLQVLCNGGVGAFLALCHLLEVGVGERPLDFEHHYYASILGIAVMSSFACVNGDTWASELGILSRSEPVLITNFKKVPRGTNGGISSWGLLVSFAGGVFVGIFYFIATWFFVDSESFQNSPTQLPIIMIGGFAGLFGSLVDSFLGATCQFSGQTPEGYIVEEMIDEKVVKISGRKILNNHSVNFFSCLLTALIVPLFSQTIWNFFTPSY